MTGTQIREARKVRGRDLGGDMAVDVSVKPASLPGREPAGIAYVPGALPKTRPTPARMQLQMS